ncbi:hypothetical protein N431DRAFT_486593 [Stipitochalara longipes BDJ]|nr:hypothetical protein N431DRAFT_486593 [Stipitochalara longipes BDJ]
MDIYASDEESPAWRDGLDVARPQTGRTIHLTVDESADNNHLPDRPVLKHGTGFKSVTSQWMKDCPDEWYMLKSYGFPDPQSLRDPWEFKKPLKNTIKSFFERLRQPDRKWAQVMRRVTTRKEQGDNLKVFISCKTLIRGTERLEVKVKNSFKKEKESSSSSLTAIFVDELGKLEEIYCPMRRESNWKELFLLQYQHANLNMFAYFLEAFANDYVESRRKDFDPRLSRLRGWVLAEMARDSHHYRQLTNMGNEMTDTLESLIDVVKSSLGDNTESKSASKSKSKSKSKSQFLTLEPVLRGCCKDIRGRLSRLTDEMETSLKLLESAQNLRQTGNVQVLTILATIFLPLSLAAGVLSMQSRFKDLGVLLYDFFGVVFLLGTAALLIITALVLWGIVSEMTTKLMTENLFKPVSWVLGIVAGVVVLIFGPLIISSFLVGMFKDVVLGAKILGYGFAAGIGGPLVIAILILLCWLAVISLTSLWNTVSSWKRKIRKDRPKDLEGEPGQGIQQEIAQQVLPKTETQDDKTTG